MPRRRALPLLLLAVAAAAVAFAASCRTDHPPPRPEPPGPATPTAPATLTPASSTATATLPDLRGSPEAPSPGATTTATPEATSTLVPPPPTPTPARGIPLGFPTPTPPIPTNTPRPTATPTPDVSRAPIVRLRHPALRIDAPVEVVGIGEDRQLGVPSDPRNLGWYADLSRPGLEGNVVISGFLYNNGLPAPFRSLNNSRGGDEVQLVLADGTVFRYRVIRIERYERDKAPVDEIIYPSRRPPGTEWLTMFTDGGNERDELGASLDLVIAERIP